MVKEVSTSSKTQPKKGSLGSNLEAKQEFYKIICDCFLLQRTYGRDPASIAAIADGFIKTLKNYQDYLAVESAQHWLTTARDFPTPADLIEYIEDHADYYISDLTPEQRSLWNLKRAGIA